MERSSQKTPYQSEKLSSNARGTCVRVRVRVRVGVTRRLTLETRSSPALRL